MQWIIGTGRVNSGWLSIKHAAALTCSTFTNSQAFLKAYLSIFCFFNESFLFKIVHYYVDKTLLTKIFVDMSYFLKIAVLSPILLTKRSFDYSSTTKGGDFFFGGGGVSTE